MKTGSLRFVHISDIHLPVKPGDCANLAALANKRFFSCLSWTFKRRHLHRKAMVDRLARDFASFDPEQILVTGDLVNLSLPGEYARARAWLETLGTPAEVMAIPGNHDALVESRASHEGLRLYGPYMGATAPGAEPHFPFVKRVKDIAFIGLSTAVATPIGWCSGRLGKAQREQLDAILEDCGKKGLCRIIALHHPPAGAHKPRGGLEDHEAFASIISARGAELILHGHMHRPSMAALPGPEGPVPVIGVASASVVPSKGYTPASWHGYAVRRGKTGWEISLDVHRLEGLDAPSVLAAQALLHSP